MNIMKRAKGIWEKFSRWRFREVEESSRTS
jgi:hypothetical protein